MVGIFHGYVSHNQRVILILFIITMMGQCWLIAPHPHGPTNQWVGLRENLQETIDFPMKYGVFL